MKNRIRYIDIAKGIAIICIILGHLSRPKIDRIVFTFHVPIFYFITGYFINAKKGIGDFIKNKARTLLVPYAVTCLVIIILGTIKGYFEGNAKDAALGWIYASVYASGGTYTEPFYIKAIGAIWFLWAAFWGSVFLRISLKFHQYVRLLFIAALFVVGYQSRYTCWLPLSIQAGACATLFMYMGYLMQDVKTYLSKMPREASVFGVCFAFFTWLAFIKDFRSFWLVNCDVGRGIIDIFGCICASAIVMLAARFIDRKISVLAGVLTFFGRYSLLVLCAHILEIHFVPWRRFEDMLAAHGWAAHPQLFMVVAGKLLLISTVVWICTKIGFVRRVFGYKKPAESEPCNAPCANISE